MKGSNPICTGNRRKPEARSNTSIGSIYRLSVRSRSFRKCKAGNPCKRKTQQVNRKKGRAVDGKSGASDHFARKVHIQGSFFGNEIGRFMELLAAK